MKTATILKLFTCLLCMNILFIDAPASASQKEQGDLSTDESSDFYDMSLEDLMNVEIVSTATLTSTKTRRVPAAMTKITQSDICASGARSLDELLEIYVPNLQIVLHLWEPQHLGLRGSVSDRDDKYLLLVNGRVMNDRLHYGAICERDLPMLQDIHHIDIIRGPGSVLYGPGALFMVVNIVTDNADTFQGFELTERLGVVDKFKGIEAKYGTQFDDGSGFFLYAGIAEQPGTSPEDAEFTPGRARTVAGTPVSGADPIYHPTMSNFNSAYEGLERIKIHGQYQKDDWTFWTRYTRGGSNYYSSTGYIGGSYLDQGSGYQQLTFWLDKKVPLSEQLDFTGSASVDIMDYSKTYANDIFASRQDEIHLKGICKWRPQETVSAAFGAEYSHERFGNKSVSHWELNPQAGVWGAGTRMPAWHTDTTSILGEVQWQLAENWTSFWGCRIDWHPFVKKEMISPRIALVYDLTQRDTVKFIVSESVRASLAENMKYAYDQGNESDYEDMRNYELHWQRQQTGNLWYGCTAFYNERGVIAWDQGNSIVAPLGEMSIYGAEIEILYKTDKTSMGLSHGYSQLHHFKLDDPSTDQFFTTEPYGYGSNLAAWHDHITKFNASYNPTKKLNVNGSMVIYWGSQGRQEYICYARDVHSWDYTEGVSSDKKIGDQAYFLNLGLGYTFDKHLKIAAHVHHILGLFDKYLNHRDYAFSGIQRASTMTTAPAASFTLIIRR